MALISRTHSVREYQILPSTFYAGRHHYHQHRPTCPPLAISLVRARFMMSSVAFMMYVVTFCRPFGGLKIVLRSRMPVRDMCRVLGMGVAVRVSTSTPVVRTLKNKTSTLTLTSPSTSPSSGMISCCGSDSPLLRSKYTAYAQKKWAIIDEKK